MAMGTKDRKNLEFNEDLGNFLKISITKSNSSPDLLAEVNGESFSDFRTFGNPTHDYRGLNEHFDESKDQFCEKFKIETQVFENFSNENLANGNFYSETNENCLDYENEDNENSITPVNYENKNCTFQSSAKNSPNDNFLINKRNQSIYDGTFRLDLIPNDTNENNFLNPGCFKSSSQSFGAYSSETSLDYDSFSKTSKVFKWNRSSSVSDLTSLDFEAPTTGVRRCSYSASDLIVSVHSTSLHASKNFIGGENEGAVANEPTLGATSYMQWSSSVNEDFEDISVNPHGATSNFTFSLSPCSKFSGMSTFYGDDSSDESEDTSEDLSEDASSSGDEEVYLRAYHVNGPPITNSCQGLVTSNSGLATIAEEEESEPETGFVRDTRMSLPNLLENCSKFNSLSWDKYEGIPGEQSDSGSIRARTSLPNLFGNYSKCRIISEELKDKNSEPMSAPILESHSLESEDSQNRKNLESERSEPEFFIDFLGFNFSEKCDIRNSPDSREGIFRNSPASREEIFRYSPDSRESIFRNSPDSCDGIFLDNRILNRDTLEKNFDSYQENRDSREGILDNSIFNRNNLGENADCFSENKDYLDHEGIFDNKILNRDILEKIFQVNRDKSRDTSEDRDISNENIEDFLKLESTDTLYQKNIDRDVLFRDRDSRELENRENFNENDPNSLECKNKVREIRIECIDTIDISPVLERKFQKPKMTNIPVTEENSIKLLCEDGGSQLSKNELGAASPQNQYRDTDQTDSTNICDNLAHFGDQTDPSSSAELSLLAEGSCSTLDSCRNQEIKTLNNTFLDDSFLGVVNFHDCNTSTELFEQFENAIFSKLESSNSIVENSPGNVTNSNSNYDNIEKNLRNDNTFLDGDITPNILRPSTKQSPGISQMPEQEHNTRLRNEKHSESEKFHPKRRENYHENQFPQTASNQNEVFNRQVSKSFNEVGSTHDFSPNELIKTSLNFDCNETSIKKPQNILHYDDPHDKNTQNPHNEVIFHETPDKNPQNLLDKLNCTNYGKMSDEAHTPSSLLIPSECVSDNNDDTQNLNKKYGCEHGLIKNKIENRVGSKVGPKNGAEQGVIHSINDNSFIVSNIADSLYYSTNDAANNASSVQFNNPASSVRSSHAVPFELSPLNKKSDPCLAVDGVVDFEDSYEKIEVDFGIKVDEANTSTPNKFRKKSSGFESLSIYDIKFDFLENKQNLYENYDNLMTNQGNLNFDDSLENQGNLNFDNSLKNEGNLNFDDSLKNQRNSSDSEIIMIENESNTKKHKIDGNCNNTIDNKENYKAIYDNNCHNKTIDDNICHNATIDENCHNKTIDDNNCHNKGRADKNDDNKVGEENKLRSGNVHKNKLNHEDINSHMLKSSLEDTCDIKETSEMCLPSRDSISPQYNDISPYTPPLLNEPSTSRHLTYPASFEIDSKGVCGTNLHLDCNIVRPLINSICNLNENCASTKPSVVIDASFLDKKSTELDDLHSEFTEIGEIINFSPENSKKVFSETSNFSSASDKKSAKLNSSEIKEKVPITPTNFERKNRDHEPYTSFFESEADSSGRTHDSESKIAESECQEKPYSNYYKSSLYRPLSCGDLREFEEEDMPFFKRFKPTCFSSKPNQKTTYFPSKGDTEPYALSYTPIKSSREDVFGVQEFADPVDARKIKRHESMYVASGDHMYRNAYAHERNLRPKPLSLDQAEEFLSQEAINCFEHSENNPNLCQNSLNSAENASNFYKNPNNDKFSIESNKIPQKCSKSPMESNIIPLQTKTALSNASEKSPNLNILNDNTTVNKLANNTTVYSNNRADAIPVLKRSYDDNNTLNDNNICNKSENSNNKSGNDIVRDIVPVKGGSNFVMKGGVKLSQPKQREKIVEIPLKTSGVPHEKSDISSEKSELLREKSENEGNWQNSKGNTLKSAANSSDNKSKVINNSVGLISLNNTLKPAFMCPIEKENNMSHAGVRTDTEVNKFIQCGNEFQHSECSSLVNSTNVDQSDAIDVEKYPCNYSRMDDVRKQTFDVHNDVEIYISPSGTHRNSPEEAGASPRHTRGVTFSPRVKEINWRESYLMPEGEGDSMPQMEIKEVLKVKVISLDCPQVHKCDNFKNVSTFRSQKCGIPNETNMPFGKCDRKEKSDNHVSISHSNDKQTNEQSNVNERRLKMKRDKNDTADSAKLVFDADVKNNTFDTTDCYSFDSSVFERASIPSSQTPPLSTSTPVNGIDPRTDSPPLSTSPPVNGIDSGTESPPLGTSTPVNGISIQPPLWQRIKAMVPMPNGPRPKVPPKPASLSKSPDSSIENGSFQKSGSDSRETSSPEITFKKIPPRPKFVLWGSKREKKKKSSPPSSTPETTPTNSPVHSPYYTGDIRDLMGETVKNTVSTAKLSGDNVNYSLTKEENLNNNANKIDSNKWSSFNHSNQNNFHHPPNQLNNSDTILGHSAKCEHLHSNAGFQSVNVAGDFEAKYNLKNLDGTKCNFSSMSEIKNNPVFASKNEYNRQNGLKELTNKESHLNTSATNNQSQSADSAEGLNPSERKPPLPPLHIRKHMNKAKAQCIRKNYLVEVKNISSYSPSGTLDHSSLNKSSVNEYEVSESTPRPVKVISASERLKERFHKFSKSTRLEREKLARSTPDLDKIKQSLRLATSNIDSNTTNVHSLNFNRDVGTSDFSNPTRKLGEDSSNCVKNGDNNYVTSPSGRKVPSNFKRPSYNRERNSKIAAEFDRISSRSLNKIKDPRFIETDLDTGTSVQILRPQETDLDCLYQDLQHFLDTLPQSTSSLIKDNKTKSLVQLESDPKNYWPDSADTTMNRQGFKSDDARARSMEFLLDDDNRAVAQAPENELMKEGEKKLSEVELRVRHSLQRLDVPDWMKKSAHPNQGFILKRKDPCSKSPGAGWAGISSKTTSMSSLDSKGYSGGVKPLGRSSVRSYTNDVSNYGGSSMVSPSPSDFSTKSAFPYSYSRWSTSRLNSGSGTVTPTESVSSQTSGSYTTRQPYLGWRSNLSLNAPAISSSQTSVGAGTYMTPAERLAHSLSESKEKQKQLNLSSNKENIPNMSERSNRHRHKGEKINARIFPSKHQGVDVHSSIKEVTSAIVHYCQESNASPRSSPQMSHREKTSSSPNSSRTGSSKPLVWLESSFVGTQPIEVPDTPVSTKPSPTPNSSTFNGHREEAKSPHNHSGVPSARDNGQNRSHFDRYSRDSDSHNYFNSTSKILKNSKEYKVQDAIVHRNQDSMLFQVEKDQDSNKAHVLKEQSSKYTHLDSRINKNIERHKQEKDNHVLNKRDEEIKKLKASGDILESKIKALSGSGIGDHSESFGNQMGNSEKETGNSVNRSVEYPAGIQSFRNFLSGIKTTYHIESPRENGQKSRENGQKSRDKINTSSKNLDLEKLDSNLCEKPSENVLISTEKSASKILTSPGTLRKVEKYPPTDFKSKVIVDEIKLSTVKENALKSFVKFESARLKNVDDETESCRLKKVDDEIESTRLKNVYDKTESSTLKTVDVKSEPSRFKDKSDILDSQILEEVAFDENESTKVSDNSAILTESQILKRAEEIKHSQNVSKDAKVIENSEDITSKNVIEEEKITRNGPQFTQNTSNLSQTVSVYTQNESKLSKDSTKLDNASKLIKTTALEAMKSKTNVDPEIKSKTRIDIGISKSDFEKKRNFIKENLKDLSNITEQTIQASLKKIDEYDPSKSDTEGSTKPTFVPANSIKLPIATVCKSSERETKKFPISNEKILSHQREADKDEFITKSSQILSQNVQSQVRDTSRKLDQPQQYLTQNIYSVPEPISRSTNVSPSVPEKYIKINRKGSLPGSTFEYTESLPDDPSALPFKPIKSEDSRKVINSKRFSTSSNPWETDPLTFGRKIKTPFVPRQEDPIPGYGFNFSRSKNKSSFPRQNSRDKAEDGTSSATLEDVLDSLLALPSVSKTPSPSKSKDKIFEQRPEATIKKSSTPFYKAPFKYHTTERKSSLKKYSGAPSKSELYGLSSGIKTELYTNPAPNIESRNYKTSHTLPRVQDRTPSQIISSSFDPSKPAVIQDSGRTDFVPHTSDVFSSSDEDGLTEFPITSRANNNNESKASHEAKLSTFSSSSFSASPMQTYSSVEKNLKSITDTFVSLVEQESHCCSFRSLQPMSTFQQPVQVTKKPRFNDDIVIDSDITSSNYTSDITKCSRKRGSISSEDRKDFIEGKNTFSKELKDSIEIRRASGEGVDLRNRRKSSRDEKISSKEGRRTSVEGKDAFDTESKTLSSEKSLKIVNEQHVTFKMPSLNDYHSESGDNDALLEREEEAFLLESTNDFGEGGGDVGFVEDLLDNENSISETSGMTVSCRYPECQNSELIEVARKSYKKCHNCSLLYCSRKCRREHWEKHKPFCEKVKALHIIKKVINKIRSDNDILEATSAVAKRGFFALGRGCVKLFFQDSTSAESFISKSSIPEAHFQPIPDIMPQELGLEMYKELTEQCRSYNTSQKFLLYVSICIFSENPIHPTPIYKREMVGKWAKLKLFEPCTNNTGDQSGKDMHNLETIVLTPIPGNLEKPGVPNKPQREEIFSNIIRALNDRGTNLRFENQDLYWKLCQYVDTGHVFPPSKNRFRNILNDKIFMCIILLDYNIEKIQHYKSTYSKLNIIDVSRYHR